MQIETSSALHKAINYFSSWLSDPVENSFHGKRKSKVYSLLGFSILRETSFLFQTYVCWAINCPLLRTYHNLMSSATILRIVASTCSFLLQCSTLTFWDLHWWFPGFCGWSLDLCNLSACYVFPCWYDIILSIIYFHIVHRSLRDVIKLRNLFSGSSYVKSINDFCSNILFLRHVDFS